MLLSEIETIVLAESGAWISGDLECLGINRNQFYRGIVIRELETYGRYRSDTYTFNRTARLVGNAGAAVDFFDTSVLTGEPVPTKDGGIFSAQHDGHNVDPGRVPLWISSVVPVEVMSSAGMLYLIHQTRLAKLGENSILHEPRTYLWHYERAKNGSSGVLYVSEPGGLDITAHYTYHRVEIYDSVGVLTDVEFEGVEEGKDEILLDMIIGKFMQMLGRSRRAFTLNNSPIQFDGEQLVSEGNQIYENAKNRLFESSEFWASLG